MAATELAHPSLNDWVVLALVAEEERHGFAIARELTPDSQLGRVWTVPRPLVYRSIERLAEARWIESVREERGDQGPRRTVMRATPIGRRRLRAWLGRPVAHPRDVRAELLLKVMLLERAGRDPRPLVQAQLDAFADVFAGITAQARRAAGPDRVVASWRLENTRAIERTLRGITQARRSS